MRRLWKEELWGRILSRCGPCQTPPPEDVRQAHGANDHIRVTIRVKWAPKPAAVKRRPPTACRFYFAEFAVPLVYIFVTPPRPRPPC